MSHKPEHEKKKPHGTPCGQVPDCNSSSSKEEVAIMHTITELRYNQVIEYYFGTATPVNTTFTQQDVDDEISTEVKVGVMPTYLEFTWDQNTSVITMEGKAGEPEPESNSCCYSTCLFEGVEILDGQPTHFVFTCASDWYGKNFVVFKTMSGTTTLNYYNITAEFP